MIFTRLRQKKIHLPEGITFGPCVALPMENLYHAPGQTAAIRLFDPNSKSDLEALREILKNPAVRRWMDDAYHLSKREYQEWAGTVTHNSFLFAVLDARVSTLAELETIHGFVFIYSEREEKFRVKRMIKAGLLPESEKTRYSLEISFAARQLAKGYPMSTGLMASAVRQACLQVQLLLQSHPKPLIEIFAFVDPKNEPAQRTLNAAAFAKIGSMPYDRDSPEDSYLYLLKWRNLQLKIRQKLIELQAIKAY